jgi:hypothetical protein
MQGENHPAKCKRQHHDERTSAPTTAKPCRAVATLKARRAASAARGNKWALLSVEADKRAEAERRQETERERERLSRLLGIGPTRDAGDAPTPERSKRKRKPNIARFLKDARKAGEKGVVRISVTYPNGFTVTVSSGDDQKQDSDGTFANPWDEVSGRATH